MKQCGSCGALNADGIDKCGDCGKPLSSNVLASEEVPEAERHVQSSNSERSVDPLQPVHLDAGYSTAVNIRRIYIVLLTMLGITAANYVAALYLQFEIVSPASVSTLRFVLGTSIAVSALIAIAGIVYSVRSKRLSRVK